MNHSPLGHPNIIFKTLFMSDYSAIIVNGEIKCRKPVTSINSIVNERTVYN